MSQPSIDRAYLFVPGTRVERVAKARAVLPHGVIVDLEDAVAPSDKSGARDVMANALRDGEAFYVRVNGAETEWFEEDLKLCATLPLHGIFVPKAEKPEHLKHAAAALKGSAALRVDSKMPPHPGPLPHSVGAREVFLSGALIPIIETAVGYANVACLCEVPRVQRLAFGSIDFQLDLRIEGEGDELLYFRSGLVLASRIAGVQPPIDGVTVEIDDVEQLRHDTLRGKRIGFGAKLCIHPKQVPAVLECFRPTSDEIAWAQRIVAAAKAANGAAVAVDGRMVDRPVIAKAEEILGQDAA